MKFYLLLLLALNFNIQNSSTNATKDKVKISTVKDTNYVINKTEIVNNTLSNLDTFKVKIVDYPDSNDKSNFWYLLNKYAPLWAAIAALVASIVAFYLGDWKYRIQAPKLKLYFDNNNKDIFKQKLAFERFMETLDVDGIKLPIFRPGVSAKIQVFNKGKLPARSVYGRVEKIVFFKDGKEDKTKHYYPTTLKWSGEDDWHPVDITQNSHFFLDLFWIKNETIDELRSFNLKYYSDIKIFVDKNILFDAIKEDVKPIDDVYWNVWINTTYNRGIPRRYLFEGELDIYCTLGSENCRPIKFTVKVNWLKSKWDNPEITIHAKKKIILKDI